MRVLVISRDLPFFPGGHGGNTRTFSLLGALATKHRFTVVTTAHTEAQQAAVRTLEQCVERVEAFEPPSADRSAHESNSTSVVQRGLEVLRRDPARALALARTYASTRLAWLPREAALWELTFANLQVPLQRALAAGPYDVLQIECSDNARWRTRIPFRGPTILIVQDVKTIVWWRRFRTAGNLLARGRALYECARFAAYERRYLRHFDTLVAMSDTDRDYLARLTGHAHIAVVPNGVDLSFFPPAATSASGAKRVIFTATLNHPPNHDGILYFVREIWPLVLRAEPDARLDIVGADPPEDVRALANERVRVTGFVPDVRPYLAAADVFVCPLRFASGSRLKILEAMAMQKPVVSTSVGAEGIDAQPGTELYVANTADEFAERVLALLGDGAARQRMGTAARALATRYDWARSAERLDDVYTDVRRRHVARRAAQPLRIGLNGLFVVPGGATGGLEPYVRNLITHLLKLDDETQYVLLTNAANAVDLAALRGENLHRHVVHTTPGPFGIAASALRALLGRRTALAPRAASAAERALAGLDLDLVHSFPGYIDAAVEAVPSVLTVADLQHEYLPELFDADELAARRSLYPASARRALRIIAISEFTRRSIIERYGVAPDKISVIPLGVAARFMARPDPADVRRVRLRHRLEEDYCIYPANLWPHKNHLRLLDALARIPAPRRPHLVLAGAAPRARIALPESIHARDLERHVRWLGFVEEDDMSVLFAGARMMVFPSLFEGFGMPIIEAMAAGCPVTCSTATALPETGGEVPRYFDPQNVDAMAGAIEELWHDAALREQLRIAGRARARHFTWQRTALRTLQLYREVGAAVRDGFPSPNGRGLG